MKRFLPFVLAFGFLFCSCSFEGEDEKSVNPDFGNGWNLGNTLDAASYGSKDNLGLSTETSWSMPETTQPMINAVAQKGFKIIRIPVSYHNHVIADDGKYTIDPEWMNRVKTVVDWSLSAGMKVIINIHHDNLSSSQMSTTYGFCVSTNTNLQSTSKAYIKAIWKQVAEFFKDYDDNLIFEVLNEPRNRDEANDGFSGSSNLSSLNKIIVEYEKAALDEIRASGGKNSTRYVMIPPYAASPDLTSGWSLPKDSAEGKLIVSVHAYTPYEFCMSSASTNTFTSSHKGSIDWLFSNLSSNFTTKGVPVIIGEASASDKNNLDERKKWFSYYCTKSKSEKIPVILWDNMVTVSNGGNINSGECHGYFNRNNLSWFFPTLVEEMIE